MVRSLGLKDPEIRAYDLEIQRLNEETGVEETEKMRIDECILDYDVDENGIRSNFRPKILEQKGIFRKFRYVTESF